MRLEDMWSLKATISPVLSYMLLVPVLFNFKIGTDVDALKSILRGVESTLR